MEAKEFYTLFDQFIFAPRFKNSDIREWFKENTKEKGVYVVFSKKFEPLYIGSSIDLKRRLPAHRHKGQRKLEGHFDDVVFIGIKYVEGDTLTVEKEYIRKLSPELNKYRYGGLKVNEG